jgi:hypothetical protein
MLRFYLPLIEPDRRISRIRLSDKAKMTRSRSPEKDTDLIWCSAVHDRRPVAGVVDLRQCSWAFHAFDAGLELRPLPSTGITRLHRYYEPLRHPKRPSLSLAGVQLAAGAATAGASRVSCFSCVCVLSSLPRWDRWVLVSFATPATLAFPMAQAGRLPHYTFRGLLNVHSRYGPQTRGVAKRLFPSKALATSLPPLPLRLLPARTIVAGRD